LYNFIKAGKNGCQKEEEVPDRRGQQLHQPEASPEEVTTQFEGEISKKV
jgi:hypothetical protein